jgi:hypothetical protein
MKFTIVLLSAIAFGAGFARPAHYDMGPAHGFTPETGEEVNTVSFANGYTIDTRVGEPPLPLELRYTADAIRQAQSIYCIVQFSGPIRSEWLARLHHMGLSPFGYLPNYAVLVKLDKAQREQVTALPMVHWVGVFQPAYKLETGLLEASGASQVTALLMPGEEADVLRALAAGRGGTIDDVQVSSFGTTVELTLDRGGIAALAGLQEVAWIQRRGEATVCNSDAQWVSQTGWRASAPTPTDTAARRVWTRGVRGQRVIMSTTDTGLNTGHNMFRDPALSITPPGIWPNHRKVSAFKLYQGASATESPYHGSHVNGTVGGDDSVTGGTSYYDGMSIKGRLYFVDLTNSSGTFMTGTDLTACWDTVYLGRGLPDSVRPIKQHSGSWGWSNSSGTYLLQDASTDAYCWAHKDFLNILAAGNEYSTRRIRNPGIAKNVLTVGATSNGTGSNAIASFSSRGPTQDNRIKPNICAPGVSLWSATNTGTNTYQQMSGTSMATPTVNGATGLIRCYLQEGYYPTGAPVTGDRLTYISSALLRSMVMASADPNIGSYAVPSFDIGWGRIDVDSVLYFAGDARKLIVRDDTTGVATGEYKELKFIVNSGTPLRVALAWTDTAAAPNANPTLVNNLNLLLTAPSGTYYRGNQYSGGQSTANPTAWDSLNVEECARVNSPGTGMWTLRVNGQQVRTARRQAFAVTVTGDVVLANSDVGVTVITVPTGTIDSTQSVTPACSVYNWGGAAASYTVRMKIGAGYNNTAAVTNHPAGTRQLVTFPAASAWPRGTLAVSCSTALANDTGPGNDKRTGTVIVRVLDAQANAITAPSGQVDSGAMLVPQAQVTNLGSQSATFNVTMNIGVYSNSQTVTGLAPGANTLVNFLPWTAGPRGNYVVACTTRLAGDMVPANNGAAGSVQVAVHDVAALAVTAPVGTLVPGTVVTPQATCRNNGTQREACKVFFRINCTPPYAESASLSGGLPGADTGLTFANWTALAGSFTASCSTWMAADQVVANNVARQPFSVGTPGNQGWVQESSMPAGAKPVKDGGWLAYDAGTARAYAARGNKQPDFFAYSPLRDSWKALGMWPVGTEGKQPSKGSVGCADGSGHVYATKGNNTQGFWRYSADGDSWRQKANVPLGPSNKKVKGGTDLAWAYRSGTGYPYLLKGYRNEFWRYHPAGDSWHSLPAAPVGASLKWDKGSWLAYDGARKIYAFKAKYHEFYAYDTEKDSWGPALQAMPIPGSAGSKKAKDGSCGAWTSMGIYALKGGNTQEFWLYSTAGNSWAEKETIPKGPGGKKVKAGSDLVAVNTVLYALKGNRTNELWMYRPSGLTAPAPGRDGVLAGVSAARSPSFEVTPNPLRSGFLHLAVGGASLVRPADVRMYDATGRCAGQWKPLLRNGQADLDARNLAAGIYVVRLVSGDLAGTQKLVVQR